MRPHRVPYRDRQQQAEHELHGKVADGCREPRTEYGDPGGRIEPYGQPRARPVRLLVESRDGGHKEALAARPRDGVEEVGERAVVVGLGEAGESEEGAADAQ